MSQKTIVQLIDDLDEGAADETVTFAIDGASYEIDLSSANAGTFRDVLAPYVAHGRRAGRGSRVGTRSAASSSGLKRARSDRDQIHAVREWARKNGHTVGEKGRIPARILDAYNAAN